MNREPLDDTLLVRMPTTLREALDEAAAERLMATATYVRMEMANIVNRRDAPVNEAVVA